MYLFMRHLTVVDRLVKKYILLLLICFGIFGLLMLSQYPNFSVRSLPPTISISSILGPHKKLLNFDGTVAPHAKCTAQTCTDDTNIKESIPTISILENSRTVNTIPDNKVDQQQVNESVRSYPNEHSMFIESNTLCTQSIQGSIPTSAMRKGYVVKDYPAAKINAVTGLYERTPLQRLNSTVIRENISDSLLAQIKEYIPHIWQRYTPFTNTYRNPCRVSPTTAYCLPYFHVLTGAKSGSTDFWYSLELHPMVFSTPKEPHWWTRQKKHPISAYDRFYKNFEQCVRTDTDPNVHKYITGDGSTSSLWDNHLTIEWSKTKKMKQYIPFTLSDVIRALTPNARIIFLLRNPINRLYSDYWYIYGGKSPQDFDLKIRAHLKIFRECLKTADDRTCAYRHNRGNVGHSALVGLYIIYVRDWLRRFPTDQVLFLRSDDWFEGQKPDILLKTYHFLDIDVTKEQMKNILTVDTGKIKIGSENVLRSSSKKKRHPMMASTKKLLQGLYAPYNKELAELTGHDGFLWKE